jgi:hypothetical protein
MEWNELVSEQSARGLLRFSPCELLLWEAGSWGQGTVRETRGRGTSAVGSRHRATTGEDTADWKYLISAAVNCKPITLATQFKAWTVFARSDTGIVGSKPTWGMDVCVCLLCVCAVLCVGSGLATDWSPVQRVLPTIYRLRNWKSGQGPQGLQSQRWMVGWMDGWMNGWIVNCWVC